MFDASAKSPQGLLFGSSYHLGNFDECVAIDDRGEKGGVVEGEYCLATIKWSRGEEAKKVIKNLMCHQSFDEFQIAIYFLIYRFNKILFVTLKDVSISITPWLDLIEDVLLSSFGIITILCKIVYHTIYFNDT